MMVLHSFDDLFATPPASRYKGVITRSQYLPMRDGTKIAIDVMLPKGVKRNVCPRCW